MEVTECPVIEHYEILLHLDTLSLVKYTRSVNTWSGIE